MSKYFTIAILALCCLQPAFAKDPIHTIRLQAIQVADDDGSRICSVTPDQVKQWVDFANNCWDDAGIRFDYRPDDGDFVVLKSTLVNGLSASGDPKNSERHKAALAEASKYPDKLVVFFRFGKGDKPDSDGFSWFDRNYVVMSGWSVMGHCGHRHTDALAHEIGHYFGLLHPFSRNFRNIEEAEKFFKENGRDPKIFDGDGLIDTPPDPQIYPFECERAQAIKLDGVEIKLPRTNLMSYYDERDSLSKLQIARALWVLEARKKNGMRMPTNTTAKSPIEAETMQIWDSECEHSIQELGDDYSAKNHLFCDPEVSGGITLAFKLEKDFDGRLDLYATQAPDFGMYKIYLDGKVVGSVFDAYAPLVMPSGKIELGAVKLTAGNHRIRFLTAGQDGRSTGRKFGIDCIDLVPVEPATE